MTAENGSRTQHTGGSLRQYFVLLLMVLLLFSLAACAGGQEEGQTQTSLILSEGWVVSPDAKEVGETEGWYNSMPQDSIPISIPGNFTDVAEYCKTAWFSNTFTPDLSVSKDQRVLAQFSGVSYYAKVWLNGTYLGDHEGSIGEFSFDITDLVKPGEENTLCLSLVAPAGEDTWEGLTGGQLPIWLGTAHIQQPVTLTVVPAVRMTDVFVDPDYSTGTLALTVTLENPGKAAVTVDLDAAVASVESDVTLKQTGLSVRAPSGTSVHTLTLTVDNFRPWSPDDPYLYAVTTTAKQRGSSFVDSSTIKTGFKDLRVDDEGYFRLNGQRFYIKSCHTVMYYPGSIGTAADTDAIKRELLYLKSCGFNTVRFLSDAALPQQLELCDSIGLIVYEENPMSWKTLDSDRTAELFEMSVTQILMRDRNHVSLGIMGMLNETKYVETKEIRVDAAIDSLSYSRDIAPDLLFLLSSGRWDALVELGSASNPGSKNWDGYMGDEGITPDSGLTPKMGDVHLYPALPYNDLVRIYLDVVGGGERASFLSEMGAGSQANIISESLLYAQNDIPFNDITSTYVLKQVALLRQLYEDYSLDKIFSTPEDFIYESQELQSAQRALLMTMIRRVPGINGYSMTMSSDAGFRGEGVTNPWGEIKPDTTEMLQDNWSDLRWCVSVAQPHIYSNAPIELEVVLSNIGVLKEREYPVILRITGEDGTVWKKELTITPKAEQDGELPIVIPVFDEDLMLALPGGTYTVTAEMTDGAYPTCGKATFYVTDTALPKISETVLTLGVNEKISELLAAQGANVKEFSLAALSSDCTVLIGKTTVDDETLQALYDAAEGGAHIVFLSPDAIKDGDSLKLPFETSGKFTTYYNWLYHFDGIVYDNAMTLGMQSRCLLDTQYYGQIYSCDYFENMPTPDDLSFVNLMAGFDGRSYNDMIYGFQLGTYYYGEGYITLSSLNLSNVGSPETDLLLANIASYRDNVSVG